MNSGPYDVWIERRADGWWCFELGGNWSIKHGPYRYRWQAWLQKVFA